MSKTMRGYSGVLLSFFPRWFDDGTALPGCILLRLHQQNEELYVEKDTWWSACPHLFLLGLQEDSTSLCMPWYIAGKMVVCAAGGGTGTPACILPRTSFKRPWPALDSFAYALDPHGICNSLQVPEKASATNQTSLWADYLELPKLDAFCVQRFPHAAVILPPALGKL